MNSCITKTNGTVVCKDPGGKSKLRFENKGKISLTKYIIDGCLVPADSEIKRCDFGVGSDEVFWLIELKGTDFKDAVQQIESTVKNTDIVPDGVSITPVIVLSKSPLAAQKQKYLGQLARFLGERWSKRIELATKNGLIRC